MGDKAKDFLETEAVEAEGDDLPPNPRSSEESEDVALSDSDPEEQQRKKEMDDFIVDDEEDSNDDGMGLFAEGGLLGEDVDMRPAEQESGPPVLSRLKKATPAVEESLLDSVAGQNAGSFLNVGAGRAAGSRSNFVLPGAVGAARADEREGKPGYWAAQLTAEETGDGLIEHTEREAKKIVQERLQRQRLQDTELRGAKQELTDDQKLDIERMFGGGDLDEILDPNKMWLDAVPEQRKLDHLPPDERAAQVGENVEKPTQLPPTTMGSKSATGGMKTSAGAGVALQQPTVAMRNRLKVQRAQQGQTMKLLYRSQADQILQLFPVPERLYFRYQRRYEQGWDKVRRHKVMDRVLDKNTKQEVDKPRLVNANEARVKAYQDLWVEFTEAELSLEANWIINQKPPASATTAAAGGSKNFADYLKDRAGTSVKKSRHIVLDVLKMLRGKWDGHCYEPATIKNDFGWRLIGRDCLQELADLDFIFQKDLEWANEIWWKILEYDELVRKVTQMTIFDAQFVVTAQREMPEYCHDLIQFRRVNVKDCEFMQEYDRLWAGEKLSEQKMIERETARRKANAEGRGFDGGNQTPGAGAQTTSSGMSAVYMGDYDQGNTPALYGGDDGAISLPGDNIAAMTQIAGIGDGTLTAFDGGGTVTPAGGERLGMTPGQTVRIDGGGAITPANVDAGRTPAGGRTAGAASGALVPAGGGKKGGKKGKGKGLLFHFGWNENSSTPFMDGVNNKYSASAPLGSAGGVTPAGELQTEDGKFEDEGAKKQEAEKALDSDPRSLTKIIEDARIENPEGGVRKTSDLMQVSLDLETRSGVWITPNKLPRNFVTNAEHLALEGNLKMKLTRYINFMYTWYEPHFRSIPDMDAIQRHWDLIHALGFDQTDASLDTFDPRGAGNEWRAFEGLRSWCTSPLLMGRTLEFWLHSTTWYTEALDGKIEAKFSNAFCLPDTYKTRAWELGAPEQWYGMDWHRAMTSGDPAVKKPLVVRQRNTTIDKFDSVLGLHQFLLDKDCRTDPKNRFADLPSRLPIEQLSQEVEDTIVKLAKAEPRLRTVFAQLMRMMTFVYTKPSDLAYENPKYMHEKWYSAMVRMEELLDTKDEDMRDLLMDIHQAEHAKLCTVHYLFAVKHETNPSDMRNELKAGLPRFLDYHCWHKWVPRRTVKKTSLQLLNRMTKDPTKPAFAEQLAELELVAKYNAQQLQRCAHEYGTDKACSYLESLLQPAAEARTELQEFLHWYEHKEEKFADMNRFEYPIDFNPPFKSEKFDFTGEDRNAQLNKAVHAFRNAYLSDKHIAQVRTNKLRKNLRIDEMYEISRFLGKVLKRIVRERDLKKIKGKEQDGEKKNSGKLHQNEIKGERLEKKQYRERLRMNGLYEKLTPEDIHLELEEETKLKWLNGEDTTMYQVDKWDKAIADKFDLLNDEKMNEGQSVGAQPLYHWNDPRSKETANGRTDNSLFRLYYEASNCENPKTGVKQNKYMEAQKEGLQAKLRKKEQAKMKALTNGETGGKIDDRIDALELQEIRDRNLVIDKEQFDKEYQPWWVTKALVRTGKTNLEGVDKSKLKISASTSDELQLHNGHIIAKEDPLFSLMQRCFFPDVFSGRKEYYKDEWMQERRELCLRLTDELVDATWDEFKDELRDVARQAIEQKALAEFEGMLDQKPPLPFLEYSLDDDYVRKELENTQQKNNANVSAENTAKLREKMEEFGATVIEDVSNGRALIRDPQRPHYNPMAAGVRTLSIYADESATHDSAAGGAKGKGKTGGKNAVVRQSFRAIVLGEYGEILTSTVFTINSTETKDAFIGKSARDFPQGCDIFARLIIEMLPAQVVIGGPPVLRGKLQLGQWKRVFEDIIRAIHTTTDGYGDVQADAFGNEIKKPTGEQEEQTVSLTRPIYLYDRDERGVIQKTADIKIDGTGPGIVILWNEKYKDWWPKNHGPESTPDKFIQALAGNVQEYSDGKKRGRFIYFDRSQFTQDGSEVSLSSEIFKYADKDIRKDPMIGQRPVDDMWVPIPDNAKEGDEVGWVNPKSQKERAEQAKLERKNRNKFQEDKLFFEDKFGMYRDWMPQVVIADMRVPRLMGTHPMVEHTAQHLKDDGHSLAADKPVGMKICLSMARQAQEPLAEALALWHEQPARNVLLKVKVLKTGQECFELTRLHNQLESKIIDIVCKMGLCINRLKRCPNLRALANFLPGLGPRKARLLFEYIPPQGITEGMPQFQRILGELFGVRVGEGEEGHDDDSEWGDVRRDFMRRLYPRIDGAYGQKLSKIHDKLDELKHELQEQQQAGVNTEYEDEKMKAGVQKILQDNRDHGDGQLDREEARSQYKNKMNEEEEQARTAHAQVFEELNGKTLGGMTQAEFMQEAGHLTAGPLTAGMGQMSAAYATPAPGQQTASGAQTAGLSNLEVLPLTEPQYWRYADMAAEYFKGVEYTNLPEELARQGYPSQTMAEYRFNLQKRGEQTDVMQNLKRFIQFSNEKDGLRRIQAVFRDCEPLQDIAREILFQFNWASYLYYETGIPAINYLGTEFIKNLSTPGNEEKTASKDVATSGEYNKNESEQAGEEQDKKEKDWSLSTRTAGSEPPTIPPGLQLPPDEDDEYSKRCTSIFQWFFNYSAYFRIYAYHQLDQIVGKFKGDRNRMDPPYVMYDWYYRSVNDKEKFVKHTLPDDKDWNGTFKDSRQQQIAGWIDNMLLPALRFGYLPDNRKQFKGMTNGQYFDLVANGGNDLCKGQIVQGEIAPYDDAAANFQAKYPKSLEPFLRGKEQGEVCPYMNSGSSTEEADSSMKDAQDDGTEKKTTESTKQPRWRWQVYLHTTVLQERIAAMLEQKNGYTTYRYKAGEPCLFLVKNIAQSDRRNMPYSARNPQDIFPTIHVIDYYDAAWGLEPRPFHIPLVDYGRTSQPMNDDKGHPVAFPIKLGSMAPRLPREVKVERTQAETDEMMDQEEKRLTAKGLLGRQEIIDRVERIAREPKKATVLGHHQSEQLSLEFAKLRIQEATVDSIWRVPGNNACGALVPALLPRRDDAEIQQQAAMRKRALAAHQRQRNVVHDQYISSSNEDLYDWLAASPQGTVLFRHAETNPYLLAYFKFSGVDTEPQLPTEWLAELGLNAEDLPTVRRRRHPPKDMNPADASLLQNQHLLRCENDQQHWLRPLYLREEWDKDVRRVDRSGLGQRLVLRVGCQDVVFNDLDHFSNAYITPMCEKLRDAKGHRKWDPRMQKSLHERENPSDGQRMFTRTNYGHLEATKSEFSKLAKTEQKMLLKFQWDHRNPGHIVMAWAFHHPKTNVEHISVDHDGFRIWGNMLSENEEDTTITKPFEKLDALYQWFLKGRSKIARHHQPGYQIAAMARKRWEKFAKIEEETANALAEADKEGLKAGEDVWKHKDLYEKDRQQKQLAMEAVEAGAENPEHKRNRVTARQFADVYELYQKQEKAELRYDQTPGSEISGLGHMTDGGASGTFSYTPAGFLSSSSGGQAQRSAPYGSSFGAGGAASSSRHAARGQGLPSGSRSHGAQGDSDFSYTPSPGFEVTPGTFSEGGTPGADATAGMSVGGTPGNASQQVYANQGNTPDQDQPIKYFGVSLDDVAELAKQQKR
ncbi:unnamed protein product [Amoebophrya sp. A120]|nr:unnamed protein product [Amoebophrya sp. A120]|eukprot:GSA120T00006625001.1